MNAMNNSKLVFGTIDDPVKAAAINAQIEAGRRNADWLAHHWVRFLPQARGKFVVVAAQEGHIAESAEEAWAWAATAHPEDNGAIVQYVRLEQGPRIYANRR
ncbi:MAG: hypothetical protein HY289_11510 [Planctomycetes bacterium]|nr:hypothetical protein [Planctomycetota bacterium]